MTLETQLREALVQQRADEMYRLFSSEPQYKTMLVELAEEFGNSMIKSIETYIEEDIGEDEKKEMLASYQAEMLPQIRAQFDNPNLLRQIITEQARNQYMTSGELRAKSNTHFKEMRESEGFDIGEDAMANFERAHEKVFEYAQENDRMLNKLSEIAETEGLEKATQKETRYAIIRERFPTPESFRDYTTRNQKNIKNLFQEMSDALMADSKAGQYIGGMLNEMGNAIEKMMRVGEKLNTDYLDKIVQEIYGSQVD